MVLDESFVFVKLCKSGLVVPNSDSVTILPLGPGFSHAKQEMRVVILSSDRVIPLWVAGVNHCEFTY